jgi:enamine deaminase RidA (YjgF/YER057c/UK114 family)
MLRSVMTRRLVSSGSPFEAEIGYSRAVVDGDWVFVSGTTGRDHDTGEVPADAVAQARLCFRTIERALAEAGASFADVVRATVILADVADEPLVAPVLAEYLQPVGPALTAYVAELLDPQFRIEIEVTALRHAR